MNNLLIYTIFLFFGLNLKITNGLYLYNILIAIFLLINWKKLNFKKLNLIFSLIIFIFIFITLCLQIILKHENLSLDSFYVPFNLIVLFSFVKLLDIVNTEKLNFKVIYLLLSLPLIMSMVMWISPTIQQSLSNLYLIERFPSTLRYGGVFGKDVNSLGIYSTLFLLLTLILNKDGKIKRELVLLGITVSSACILLSGMRTGLLVFIGLLVFFNKRLGLIRIKQAISFFIFFSFACISIYLSSKEVRELFEFIVTRFSVSHLIFDFNFNEQGNLRTAIEYFYRVTGGRNIDFSSWVLGLDSKINYADNFYIFLFLKHGIVVLFALTLLGGLFVLSSEKNSFMLYAFFATILIGVKGIFIFNNSYMFLMLFMITIWSRKYAKHEQKPARNLEKCSAIDVALNKP